MIPNVWQSRAGCFAQSFLCHFIKSWPKHYAINTSLIKTNNNKQLYMIKEQNIIVFGPQPQRLSPPHTRHSK